MEFNLQKNDLINGCKHKDHDPNLCVPVSSSADPKGIGPLLLEKLRKFGDQIVQIDDDTNTTETFASFLSKCIRAAQAMTAKGIKTDDIISFCTYNNKQCFIPFIAAILLGNKVAPLDPALDLRDATHLYKLTKPRMIFCDAEGEKLMEKVLEKTDVMKTELVIFGCTERNTSFSDFQITRDSEDSFKAKVIDDIKETAIIFFTSGTTGSSKGVCLSHSSLLHQFQLSEIPYVHLAVSRLYWLSAGFSAIASIISGATWIVCSNFEINNVCKIIEKYKVNFISSGSYVAYQFLENKQNCKYDLSSIHLYLVIGSAIGNQNQIELRNVFPNAIITGAYGLTEMTGGVIAFKFFIERDLINKKIGSCGQVCQGFCVKVVDPETRKVLGANQPGELLVKSNFVMVGYFNDPDSTADCFDEDGYFCTGDILYYDEDYCFYFVDRIKSMMKYKGWMVPPITLEEELLTHADVLEATVIGIPVDSDGDHPTAIVVLKKGSKVTSEELVKYIDGRVGDMQKLRGGVKIIDSIPKTISQKMRKLYLKSLIMEGKL